MDIITLTAEVVKASAWPATTILFALLFRHEFKELLGGLKELLSALKELLNRLRKGKLGAAELEFIQEEVAEAKKDMAEIAPQPKPAALNPEAVRLAVLNPRGAMVSAWFEIEVALKNLAQKHNILNAETQRNPSTLVRALAKANIISAMYIPPFLALYRLRNSAAHETDFDQIGEAIIGYLEIAEEMKQLLLQAD